MYYHKPLPFYMTYPLPVYKEQSEIRETAMLKQVQDISAPMPSSGANPIPGVYWEQEEDFIKDLEYLQQMYPVEAKNYQRIIAAVLDKIDYEGSFIYDEYPDKVQLYRLGQNIISIIRLDKTGRETQEGEIPIDETQWKWIEDYILVLLYYEIYKRRHQKNSGMTMF